MARNLANIWAKYPQYSEKNTVMVSSFPNEIEDFQRNDVVIPNFDPFGQTDMHSDLHLSYLQSYLAFLLSLEDFVGNDIRMRMEGYSYLQYC